MRDPLDEIGLEQFLLREPTTEKTCARQVTGAISYNIMAMSVLVIGFKFFKHVSVSIKTGLVVNVIATSVIIAWISADKLLAVFIYNLFGHIALKRTYARVRGYIILGECILGLIILQLVCQYFDREQLFLSIRGILMMHIMRLATVAFDIEQFPKKKLKFPDFAAYVEYVYYPPLVVFGPYLTFEQFTKMRNSKFAGLLNEVSLGLNAVALIFTGVTFGVMSSCHFDIYTPTSQFIEDVVTAMSFRFSHYFIGLTAQGFLVFLGSDVTVVDPMEIEFSRSMLLTVSEWNKPFHTFLHQFVFRGRFFKSTALNVLLTFVVSSLLHGLDFQMSITLFSLAFFAYSETAFRKRLAARLSMCVAAKPCKYHRNRRTCTHRAHTSDFGLRGLINLSFMLLSMYHLVFTGMTFTDDYSAVGYPLDHAFHIWSTHLLSSFFISAVLLFLSKYL
ncbi:unnamed protein product [Caenorhabditis sp. 36 PRJEB53466]|nr:unnamed protein product [Caenorhabditis sp. 36 PRJEB53466]